jgi:hypothetical protein
VLSRGRFRGLTACTVAALLPAGNAVAQHSVAQPVQLPAPAAVGQAALSQSVIQTTIDGGEVTLQLVTSSQVTSVAANGSYTATSIIEAVDVTNAPASANVTSWNVNDLVGSSFDRTFAASGAPLTAPTRSATAQSVILDSVSMVSLGFPAAPVAVGDSWTVDGRIVSHEMTFDVTYQCRLAAVADGTYSVDVSYAQGFNASFDGVTAEGTISGTGTLSGSLANPLMLWGALNQTIDGVRTTGTSATTLRQDTSITVQAAEG